jgi:hypothetical protein
MLYALSQQWANNDDRKNSEVRALQVLAIIGFVLTALYVCLLCVMRKRIMLALGIVKEASRALAAMPILTFLPVIQAAGIIVFLVPWTIYSIYLASSGDIKVQSVTNQAGDETQYKTMNYDKNTRLAFLYLLFCWFWTSEFILAIGQIVSAMSIAAWYFTRDKKSEGNRTVLWVRFIWPSTLLVADSFLLCAVFQNHSDLPSGHSCFRVTNHCHHQDHPCGAGLPTEEGQEVRQQACPVRAARIAVLHVVCREVHALPQQERVHPNRHIRLFILQGVPQCLLPDCQKCAPRDGGQYGGRLRALPGQGEGSTIDTPLVVTYTH